MNSIRTVEIDLGILVAELSGVQQVATLAVGNAIMVEVNERIACISFNKLGALLLMLFLAAPISIAAAQPTSVDEYITVSLPAFTIGDKETIVQIDCELRAALITRLKDFRNNWNIQVRNGEAARSKLKIEALYLSAGFRKSDLSYFKDFMTIYKHEPFPETPLFDMTVWLTVADEWWQKVRYIKFTKAQIIQKPITVSGSATQ